MDDFERAPSTDFARDAFSRGDLKSIKREHIVPRAVVLRIVLQTGAIDDTKRVIAEYSRVALVREDEHKKLKPKNTMPPDWAKLVDWRRPPQELPIRGTAMKLRGRRPWSPVTMTVTPRSTSRIAGLYLGRTAVMHVVLAAMSENGTAGVRLGLP